METMTKRIKGSLYGTVVTMERTVEPKDEFSWYVTDKFNIPIGLAFEIKEFRKFFYDDYKKGGVKEYRSNKWEFVIEAENAAEVDIVKIIRKSQHQYKPLPGSKLILNPLEGFEEYQEY